MSERRRGVAFDSAEDWYRTAAGTVLRRLREGRGWSFREIGEQVGVAHTTLYAVERGEATPGIDVLDRVARACDLTLTALLAMIIDELRAAREHAAMPANPLADIVEAAAGLSARQRTELLGFIDYLRFRDRDAIS